MVIDGEKKEPVICLPVIKIEVPYFPQASVEKPSDALPEKESGVVKLLLFGFIILTVWYICYGWEFWK